MRIPPTKVRALVAYFGAAALSVYAAIAVLQLWRADLRVPFDYGGDALFYALAVKSVVEHGWFLDNPTVGAPGVLHMHDYPFLDNFHLLVIKVMALFSSDWALLFNSYYLLGFPAITLAAMFVFRRCGAGFGPAIVGSVLYAFLPSRLMKGEGHLFPDSFYQVPLALLVMIWVASADPPLTRDQDGRWWPGLDLGRRRSWGALLVCLIGASMSPYYAFFTAFLLAGIGIWAAVERRSARNAVAGLGLAAVVVAGLWINGLPTVFYRARHGTNPVVAKRNSGEAEMFGLKLTQLLLPVDAHRIPSLRRLKDRYNYDAPLITENSSTSLGLVGGCGFVFLLGVLLGGRRSSARGDDLLRPLAVLNALAFLLATIGGVGALVATLVSPQIRTYARMNVFIGFASLFAVVSLLDRLTRRYPSATRFALPLVLTLGVLDQTTARMIRPYAWVKKEYLGDRAFVRQIEATVAPHSMVFQLPFVPFPESAPVDRLSSNSLVIPYLHSRSLRWSFPTMRGRSGEVWARDVASRPATALIDELALAGFAGILVERSGYPDDGRSLEEGLRQWLSGQPIVSQDRLRAFYRLERRSGSPPLPVRTVAEQQRALAPLVPTWGNGCFGEEVAPGMKFHWCDVEGDLQVDNELDVSRRVTFRMTPVPAQAPGKLSITGDLISADLRLGADHAPFVVQLEVPPGRHVIHFHGRGAPAVSPGDPRTLIWRAENVVLEEVFSRATTSTSAPP